MTGEVDFDEAKERIVAAHKVFRLRKITFDQWNSALMIQQLKKQGIRAEELSFTTKTNVDIYSNLHMHIAKNRVKCRRFPLLKAELAALIRKIKPTGSTVEAPTVGPVKTDDAADALAAAMYHSTLHIGEGKRVFLKI